MTAELLVSASPGELRAALIVDGVPLELLVDPDHERTRVGELVAGRVVRMLPSGSGAIVEAAAGDGLFVSRPPKGWHEGLRAKVRIVRDATPGKLPVAEDGWTIVGRRLALTVLQSGERPAPGLSHRIVDAGERGRLHAMLAALQETAPVPEAARLTARRWAVGADEATLAAEIAVLLGHMPSAEETAVEGTVRPADPFRDLVRDLPAGPIEVMVAGRARGDALRRTLADLGPPETRLSTAPAPEIDLRLDEIEEQALDRHVPLPSGGRVTIDRTAALTAFDVDTAAALEVRAAGLPPRRVNEEAGRAIAAALRLRGVGGLAVIDFVGGRREAEASARALRRAVADDPARVEIAPPSGFGLVELSRQHGRRPIADIRWEPDRQRLRTDAVALAALRRVLREADVRPAGLWEIRAEPDVAALLVDGALAPALAAAGAVLGGGLSVRADPACGRETVDVRPL